MSISDVLGFKKDKTNKNELKIELMKLMAERNKERFLEYDRATDTLVTSEIKDGKFQVIEAIDGFVAPLGLPIATTLSPTTASSELPNSAGLKAAELASVIFKTARSLRVSPAT